MRSEPCEEDLDLALGRLGARERAAILLRFFEGRSYGEVAIELRLTTEAAKKQVQRAIQRLRELLRGADGSPLCEIAVVSLIAAARRPSPAHLHASILQAALSRGCTASAGAALAKGALIMMNIARMKLIGCCVLIALAACGVALWAAESEQTLPLLQIVVLDPSGKPVANASIEPATNEKTVEAYAAPAPGSIRTDSLGRFSLPALWDNAWFIVKSDRGFGHVKREDLANSHTITIHPWGSIEGTVRIGKDKAAGQTISVIGLPNFDPHFLADGVVANPVGYSLTTTSDANGHFSFARVAPGDWIVARVVPKPGFQLMSMYPQVVTVPEAKRVTVALGGSGRTVVGRAVPQAGQGTKLDFDPDNYLAGQICQLAVQPASFPGASPEQYPAELKKWALSPAGKDYRLSFAYTYWFPIAADGSFRVDDLPAGSYMVKLNAGNGANLKFTVPVMPLGYTNTPLDIGNMEVK